MSLRRFYQSVAIGLVLLMSSVGNAQTTWYVDDDAPGDPGPGDPAISSPSENGTAMHPFDAIQEAIDASADYDEVVVSDGTYTGVGNKNLDFGGKLITVRSANGPGNCVIDCEGDGRGFYFHTGETHDAIVDGLTITNGFVDRFGLGGEFGGGVFCDASSPQVTHCVITNNRARCVSTAGGGGGGVYCRDSAPILSDCLIVDNIGETYMTDGGGLHCEGSSPTVLNCTLSENIVGGDGGGLYCREGGSPLFVNCLVSGNIADGGGGGLGCYHSSPTLVNCTITQNTKYGVYLHIADAYPVLSNCIVWGNGSSQIYDTAPSEPNTGAELTYCSIQGGWEGEGNIDVDPLLTPDGHLRADSPCRNAGNPEGDYGDQTDVDGEGRVIAGRVDIGADEFLDTDDDGLPDWWEQFYFDSLTVADSAGDEDDDGATNLDEYTAGTHPIQPPQTYYVSVTGDDEWDGLLPVWDGTHGPKATIRAAIDVTFSFDEIIVAEGTYVGEGNRNLDFGGRAITVRSADGDPANCVIDCEEDGRAFLFHRGETSDSVVSGFTITNGWAPFGGGVSFTFGSPSLAHCVITHNVTRGNGGGVYCFGGSPILMDCTIVNNAAESAYVTHGGGV